MAVLDFGRKRADSYPLLRNDHQELFETTLSHRESLSVISGELCGIKTRLSHADGASGPYHGSQLSGTGIASAPYRDPVESGLSNGEGGSPSTPDPDNGRLNFPHAEAHDIPTQVGLRSKRGNPASMSLDTAHPDQSDHHGAKQGRRLRPRLRSIISAPLASSRHSSSSTLARLAGALSSRKPSMESVVDTVNPPSSITSPCPPSTPPSSRLKSRNQSVGGRDDTIWMQRKHSSSIAKTPRSPIPASRSIPPTLQRGITSPILALPQLSASVALKEPAPRLDHFERILPRELQVMIMSKLLEDGASRERDRRWSGAVGARRELIRLSRVSRFGGNLGQNLCQVSKSWRSLCFDGQLWADVDLAPFAAHLSARTLRHIVNHTAPFISSLSLRGMRSLPDVDLLPSLARFGLAQAMPTLTTLGLQCCKIDSHTIIAVIKNAPRLRRINLKGVQTVNLDVLYCLASYSKMLESLDVSGCWHISLEDVRSFVDLLDDDSAGRLNTLRLAVVHSKTEGPIPADLLVSVFGRLRNLETVNLQGCRQLLSTMLIAACEGLRMQSRTSAIRHLNLSGCTGLRADVLLSMNGLFPELRYLEMAGMLAFFQENSRSDRTAFNRFLQSCPFLERLDIEETAGTSVDDSTLRTLARMSHLTHLQIGFASSITPEAMVGFIRGCPSLQVLHADVSICIPGLSWADVSEHSSKRRSDSRIPTIAS